MRPAVAITLGLVVSIAACALLAACARQATVFEPAPPAPVSRVEGPSAVIAGRLYVFGGFDRFDGKLRATRRVDVFDPKTDSWSQAADMPTPTTHRTPAIDGTTVWFAGGFEGDNPGPTVDHAWRYDAVADRWESGRALPQPRAGGVLALLGRTLHYVGGFDAERKDVGGDHWALDLDGDRDGEWRPRAPLPCSRGHLAGLVVDGKLHALGGQRGHRGPHPDLDCHQVYLPDQDRWVDRAPLPSPRSHIEPGSFLWNGKIVVVGGRDNIDRKPTLADVSVYDVAGDRWTEAPPLPVALLAPVAVPLEGRLFVTMGSRDNWKTPQSASWRGPLP